MIHIFKHNLDYKCMIYACKGIKIPLISILISLRLVWNGFLQRYNFLFLFVVRHLSKSISFCAIKNCVFQNFKYLHLEPMYFELSSVSYSIQHLNICLIHSTLQNASHVVSNHVVSRIGKHAFYKLDYE